MHAWRRAILESEQETGHRDTLARRRFNAAAAAAAAARLLPSCRSAHPLYSRSAPRPPGSTAKSRPSACRRKGRTFPMPRKYSRSYCNRKRRSGKKMGFTERASCAAFFDT